MTEKNLVVDNKIITYKGIFRANEVLMTISDELKNLGYQEQEKKTEETVVPAGKSTYIELRPFKEKAAQMTLMIKIKIHFNNVVEVVKEVDEMKRRFQQGDVEIAFDAWSVTDYGKRWGMRPWFYFMKGFVNKYIYRYPLEAGFVGEVGADTEKIHDEVKALLNLYKYQVTG
ncbi:MAG: hypothetical protein ABIA37_05055 [Candidatus Woesearchaeota archaeon]